MPDAPRGPQRVPAVARMREAYRILPSRAQSLAADLPGQAAESGRGERLRAATDALRADPAGHRVVCRCGLPAGGARASRAAAGGRCRVLRGSRLGLDRNRTVDGWHALIPGRHNWNPKKRVNQGELHGRIVDSNPLKNTLTGD